MGDLECPISLDRKSWIASKKNKMKWKLAAFFQSIVFIMKKIQGITSYLVKLEKIIQSNHVVSNVSSNKNRELLIRKVISFFVINQLESSFTYKGTFFLISTNQNPAWFIRKFLSFLISNNQNRALLHSNFCGINQSEWSIHRFLIAL